MAEGFSSKVKFYEVNNKISALNMGCFHNFI